MKSCGCCSQGEAECPPTRATSPASPSSSRIDRAIRLQTLRFAVSALLFAVAWALSGRLGKAPAILALFVASYLLAGYRVIASAFSIRGKAGIFDENFLMTIATIGAFAVGEWSEGAAVMLFFNLGEILQETAVNRSRRSIASLMDVRPDRARVVEGTIERIVHPSEVEEGSLVRVLPGEKVPLDGIVEEGSCLFDTSALTGESLPRELIPGSTALAGFLAINGSCVIRSSASYGKSAAARMLELVELAQDKKAKAERLITSFARVYTPIVTIGAVLLATIPPTALALAAGSLPGWADFSPWAYRALVFLVISCPCAFVISVPLGYFGGIGGAARQGILVKGAQALDSLAKVSAVVFDKTGTLTKGSFIVRSVNPEPGFDEDSLLALCASAESRSRHPLAKAIVAHAESRGISSPPPLSFEERGGLGIYASLPVGAVLAGSSRLLSDAGVAGVSGDGVLGTSVHVAVDGTYAGFIEFSDTLKDGSRDAIRELRALGVLDIAMITGDGPDAARRVAESLDICDWRAGVLPHQKVEIYEALAGAVRARRGGGSAFVGDGINDAPVIARSDVGIAMGGIGSDAACEAADVVLMNDDPRLVARAIAHARRTRVIVGQNIALSFAVKIGFLALGAFGIATLWEAVIADVGVALAATANALRARSAGKPLGRPANKPL